MTRLRARVAERLVEAQQNAAMLTTFNEVNISAVMGLRNRYKDPFEKAHGVRLGFMSFFVKAAVEGLQRFPVLNASVDGNDIIYHGYYDIGIAVSCPGVWWCRFCATAINSAWPTSSRGSSTSGASPRTGP